MAVHQATTTLRAPRRAVAAAPALFAAAFAAQATVFVLPPLLPALAATFGVSVGVAGQLRAVSGVAALFAPVVVVVLARRLGTRNLILLGLLLDGAGSSVALVAWTFRTLVVAHALMGAGLAMVVSSCLIASAEWTSEAGRGRLLSWTTMGMGAAAVVVTPLAGAVALLDWRVAWLLPTAGSLVAGCAMATRPSASKTVSVGSKPTDRTMCLPGVASWCTGEFFAYAGWSVVTVYSAALFIQSYGTSPPIAGVIISASASAFLMGNRLIRPRLDAPRAPLLVLALAMAGCGAALGLVRTSFTASAFLLVLLGLFNGGRSPAGSGLGLLLAPQHRLQLMAARTSAQSLGYLVGASCGGLVLIGHGFAGLGALMGVLFGMAALPHAGALAGHRRNRSPRPTTSPTAHKRSHEGGQR